ncbi:MAG: hypothetical protein LBL34_04330 [Clostridiales bacterium]|nr:hypothetical protein [Clostridiales bacterium]
MVRTVVEYRHIYLMILSPSGWMTLPKTDDKNFRPLSFGGGKLNREMFEKSLWGEMSGAEEGVVVYENPESDKPRQMIYRGLNDIPYDNKMEIDVRWLRETGVYKYDGTAGNDVFAVRFKSGFRVDKNTYVLSGNGGSDIYDCYTTASVIIRIEKRSDDEKNFILIGNFSPERNSVNELIPRREGNNLVLVFVRDENSRISLENWYLGAKYRPDMIMDDHGGAWNASAIEQIAKRAAAK